MCEQRLGATECGKLKPDDEHCLEGEEPWNVVEKDGEGETFNEVEETEDNPICQPLYIVVVSLSFKSLHREVSRDDPANKVGNRRREGVEGVENNEEHHTTEEGVALWNLRALLESSEGRILRKLLIKLVNVVIGLILSLDEGRVLLDLLRSRHLAMTLVFE